MVLLFENGVFVHSLKLIHNQHRYAQVQHVMRCVQMPVCDPPPDKFGKLVSNFTIKPRWMLSQLENNPKKKINNMKKMQKKTKKKRRFVIRSKNSKPPRKKHRKRRRRGGQDKSRIQNDVETKWGNHVLTCSERFENCIATVFSDGAFSGV